MARTYFKTEEVAEMYSTTPDVVRRWIRLGRLEAENTGRGRNIYRVSQTALDDFAEANRKGSAA